MISTEIPLLSPKPLAEYAPEDFLAYVRTLYVEPERAAPPAAYTISLNAKGNPVVRIRREPKWLTAAEVASAAAEIGWPLQALWMHLRKKKIDLRLPERKPKR